MGEEHSSYGQSIYDIKEDETRERMYYERELDENYPSISKAYSDQAGGANVWRIYTYTGDRSEMYWMYDYVYETVPMVDSYY